MRTLPASTGVIIALGCVRPGHMMLAPDNTNLKKIEWCEFRLI
jgi:hypothetical protein